jgi:hypothetical protein
MLCSAWSLPKSNLRFANSLRLSGWQRRLSPALLWWCLSVANLKTDFHLRRSQSRKCPQMTPVPAKVVTVDKQSSQYRVLVQIELSQYLGSFHNLRFGKRKPFTGSFYHGQLDLFYYRDPRLKAGKPFPLWTIK